MSGLGAFKRLNSAQLTDHHGWTDGWTHGRNRRRDTIPLLLFAPTWPFTDLTFSHPISHLPDTFYLHPTSYLSVTPINLFIHCLYFAVSVSPPRSSVFSVYPSPSSPLSPTLAFFSIPILGVVVVCNWFGFCFPPFTHILLTVVLLIFGLSPPPLFPQLFLFFFSFLSI